MIPQCAVTVVLAVEELLLSFESALELLTVAVSLRTVPVGAVTFALIWRVAPLRDDHDSGVIGPTGHVTVCPATVQANAAVVQVSLRFTTAQLILLPDALSGGSLAGAMDLPLLLTADDAVSVPESTTVAVKVCDPKVAVSK